MSPKSNGGFRYRVNSALGFVSACLCGTFLLTASVLFLVWPIAIASLLHLIGLKDAFTIGVKNDPYHISDIIVSFLLSLFALYSGLVLSRFLLRAIPPRLSGKSPTSLIALLLLINLGAALGMTTLVLAIPLDFLYKISFGVSSAIWSAGLLVPLVTRHLKPRAFLAKPFVLYLRRFSTFSDRAVISIILKASPAGVPVVFLTPTRTRAGDWNPFLIGFAGIKFRRPFRSIPIILRARDEEWRLSAEELVSHAKFIILDISEGSDAIQTEIIMLSEADRWSDTLIIEQQLKNNVFARSLPDVGKGALHIVYTKSWFLALPRLVLGLLLIICAWSLAMVFSIFIYFGLISPSMKHLSHMEVVDNIYRTAVPLFLLLSLPYGYYSFFVRPSVDRKLSDALKKRLHGVLSA